MAKVKMTLGDKEIKDIGSYSINTGMPSLDEIEKFILDAGSDNLPAFGGAYEGGVHCQQIADELAPCILAILKSEAPIKSYLEIGVAAGGTTYLFDHYFKPGKMVLVDDNQHPKAKLRPDILKGIERQEIVGNSNDPVIVAAVQPHGPFDIILIDSAHDYPSVKADVDSYLPMLNAGGFLILHDSLPRHLGIIKVVGELKGSGDVEFINEYVTTKHASPCGLALFRKVVKD